VPVRLHVCPLQLARPKSDLAGVACKGGRAAVHSVRLREIRHLLVVMLWDGGRSLEENEVGHPQQTAEEE
jgi:hypothetical protein